MYLTIDIGGTKTLLATFSNDGEIKSQKKIPTPKKYSEFAEELTKNVLDICGDMTPEACSVGMPGKINREKGIDEYFNNMGWRDVPIKDLLSTVVSCPIYLENDANLAGLAEANSLIDKFRKVLYITVSTGIGGVYVIDGTIDPNTIDAEIGHMLFEHEGKLTRWEEFASGKAIVRQTGKMASEITDESDWYLVARNIAIGLINVIYDLTPECIVFGGGVGSHLDKFKVKLMSELELYKNDLVTLPEIRKAQHPEEAVIYGGYLLCRQNAVQ